MFTDDKLIETTQGLRQFALKLCGNRDDAEDLLQTTTMKALENRDKFKTGSNLFSWTSKIMYNQFVSNYRKKVKRETQFDPENYIKNESRKPRQLDVTELGKVSESIDELSKEHKQVISMVCLDGKSYQEVSKELDIPIGTVRSRLSRARQELSEGLDEPENMAA